MIREEVVEVIRLLVASYPRWKPDSLPETINAYTMAFKDYPSDIIKKAAIDFIKTERNGFAPSPGQIIGCIDLGDDMPNEEQAWDIAYKAISRSYSIDAAQSEYEKLPVLIRNALGSSYNMKELSLLEKATVMTVEKSHFMRVYRNEVEKMIKHNRTAHGLLELKEKEATTLIEDKENTDVSSGEPETLSVLATPEQIQEYMEKLRKNLSIKEFFTK